jgi:putative ABC transport system permease protein
MWPDWLPPRRRPDHDFAEEIESHIESEKRSLVAGGKSPAEAELAARRTFGNVLLARERYYESWRFHMMSQFLTDVRTGFRQVRQSPGFALLAIATMALGIGANVALFSVVHAILLKPLPYQDAERIARVWMDNRRLQMREDWASWLNYQDYKRLGTSFEQMAAFSVGSASLTSDGEPERVDGIRAEAELFNVLGAKPIIGRLFTKDEEAEGKNNVWVIGWQLWQRRFGGREDVLGKKVEMDGQSAIIIGVLRPEFRFPTKTTDYYTPLVVPEGAKRRVGYWLQMAAKVRPGVKMEAVQTEMQLVGTQLEQQYPAENAGYGIFVNPLENHIVGETRTPLLLLLGAVGFVLLIACVNVAGLMLARAETRGREVALRAALGAGRGRLITMVMAESTSLALIAGFAGLAAAWIGVRILVASAPPDLPRLSEIGLNGPVLMFALAATVLTAVLSGLAPAWTLARLDLNRAIRDGGRSMAGAQGAERTRAKLVIAECMLAVMLLAGAALLLRSFTSLRGVDPGFRTQDVLTLQVATARTTNDQRPQVAEFYRQLLEKVGAMPGVAGATAITTLHLSETPNSGTFTLEDRPPFPEAEQIEATTDRVVPNFFEVLQVKLKYGRRFDQRDGAEAPRAIIINDSFAKRYWPGRDPVGQRMVFGRPSERNPWITIVGVVEDMHRRGLHRPARLETFLPVAQSPARGMQLLVAASDKGSALRLTSAVRAAIRSLDARAPITQVSTVEDEVGESLAGRRFQTMLLSLFAILALVLAAVGIFGLIYQTVLRRTQEIGVRMALGAQSSDVVNMVIKRGMILIATGVGLGIAGSLALAKVVQGLLYGVTPFDILSYVAAALVLGAFGLLACWLPARRVTLVDPLEALRHE